MKDVQYINLLETLIPFDDDTAFEGDLFDEAKWYYESVVLPAFPEYTTMTDPQKRVAMQAAAPIWGWVPFQSESLIRDKIRSNYDKIMEQIEFAKKLEGIMSRINEILKVRDDLAVPIEHRVRLCRIVPAEITDTQLIIKLECISEKYKE